MNKVSVGELGNTTTRRRTINVQSHNKNEDVDVFDCLPQPYRMITKLIEMEIFDATWLEIIRKHPDLQVDSNGDQITLSRNHKLNESFPCSKMKELMVRVSSIVETNGIVCSVDTNGTFSVLSGDNYEFIISEELFPVQLDEADVVSVGTAPTTASIKPPTTTETNIAPPTLTPLTQFVIGPTFSLSQQTERDSNIVNFHSRVVVYGLVMTSEPKPLPIDGKKLPPPAKGAPSEEEDKFVKYRVLVVDVRRVVNFAGQPQLTIKIVTEIVTDKIPFDVTLPHAQQTTRLHHLLYEEITTSFSADGLILTVVSSGPSGGCRMYLLPVDSGVDTTSGGGEHPLITTTTAAASLVPPLRTGATSSTAPTLLAQLDVNSSILRGFKVHQLIIIPPPVIESNAVAVYVQPPLTQSQVSLEAKNIAAGKPAPLSARPGSRPPSRPGSAANTPRHGGTAPRTPTNGGNNNTTNGATHNTMNGPVDTPPPVDHEQMTVAVILRDAPFWMILGLRSKKNDVKPPEPVDPKAKPVKPVEGTVAPVVAPYLFDVYVKCEWKLTSSVSSLAMDKRHEILALGQSDGEVSLWNLAERSLISILGRHKASVSAMHLVTESDCSQYYLISGGNDGTICFYSTLDTDNNLSNNNNNNARFNLSLTLRKTDSKAALDKRRSIATLSLQNYRNDLSVSGDSEPSRLIQFQTANNKISTIPLLFAQFSCGRVLIYDFKTCTLVGRAGDTERDGFNTTTMCPVTQGELLTLMMERRDSEASAVLPVGGVVAPTPVSTTTAAILATPIVTTIKAAVKPSQRLINTLSRSISVVSNKHFHCVYTRQNVPTMFSYSLSAIMKQYTAYTTSKIKPSEVLSDPRDERGAMDDYNDNTSLRSGKTKLSTSTALNNTKSGFPSSQLRLTEERLHALELSFRSGSPTQGDLSKTTTSGVAIEVRKTELNPRRVIHKDVLRSKIEREGRKARFSSTLNELSSYL